MTSNNHRKDEVRRDDLRQKDEGGKDATRTGGTGGDMQAGEWKPGDEAHHRTENPDTGSSTGNGTNAGKGGARTGGGQ